VLGTPCWLQISLKTNSLEGLRSSRAPGFCTRGAGHSFPRGFGQYEFLCDKHETLRTYETSSDGQLGNQGPNSWELYLRPEDHPKDQTVSQYKSGDSTKIIAQGYRILLNVGDQVSDLAGKPQAVDACISNPDHAQKDQVPRSGVGDCVPESRDSSATGAIGLPLAVQSSCSGAMRRLRAHASVWTPCSCGE
jgi:HAD superfamily, subfamily IIIB (Acid phosphatase)